MSFREKSAWISLVTTLLVWSGFFILLFHELASRAPNSGRLLASFVGSTILMIVLQIAIHIVIAISAPKDVDAVADERERMIELKASRIGFVTLMTLSMGAVIALPLVGVAGPQLFPSDPLTGSLTVLGGAIFLSVILAELAHDVSQIVFFRRPL
jgi:hypothetical protein